MEVLLLLNVCLECVHQQILVNDSLLVFEVSLTLLQVKRYRHYHSRMVFLDVWVSFMIAYLQKYMKEARKGLGLQNA